MGTSDKFDLIITTTHVSYLFQFVSMSKPEHEKLTATGGSFMPESVNITPNDFSAKVRERRKRKKRSKMWLKEKTKFWHALQKVKNCKIQGRECKG